MLSPPNLGGGRGGDNSQLLGHTDCPQIFDGHLVFPPQGHFIVVNSDVSDRINDVISGVIGDVIGFVISGIIGDVIGDVISGIINDVIDRVISGVISDVTS